MRDLRSASDCIRRSIATARHASSAELVAEARMTLAAVLVVRGFHSRAISEIDGALEGLKGAAAARALTQRAAIYQVLGQDSDAFADLRLAMPVLSQARDVQWLTRAYSNRSLLLITRRRFARAEADLVAARKLCTDNGLILSAGYVEQNLGVLKASQGDVVAAFEQFDRAEQCYRAANVEVGSLMSDRAELLLSTRLVEEARAAADQAVQTYHAQKRNVSVPNARLLLSTIALVQGDTDTARTAAEQAMTAFRRLNRSDGLALARFARLQAVVAAGARKPSPAEARRCATELAAVGWLVPSLEARLLAGRLSLERGDRPAARRDFALASRARRAGPADARARAWLGEAMLRLADGRRRAASVALSTGVRVIEDHQASLGASELRAHVSLHRGALAQMGLKMAIESGHARSVLSWAERGRASAILLRAPTRPDDDVLARTLADLRQTMTELSEARAAGTATGALLQRQVALERAIADRSRQLPPRPGSARARPKSVTALCDDLGEAALIEYVVSDGQISAVTATGRRVRLWRLGTLADIENLMVHLPFALHRLASPRAGRVSRQGAGTAVSHIRAQLDDLLLVPLRSEIGSRPLIIAPTGSLQTLPWAVLPTCDGRPVTVVPSAALWHSAVQQRRTHDTHHVAVIAGPGLPGARAEAAAVSQLYPGARYLEGGDATGAAACSAMDGAALVHIAAHGRMRSDNPLFSSLVLADGPLTVYDLERLHRAPEHVVLAACETAHPHLVGGGEVLGLAVALLARGTASLVAPLFPVLDAVTVDLMLEYHRQLLTGASPAAGLATAREKLAADGPARWATIASFLCMGAGL
jgi:CHAT domain-containing protein